MGKTLQIKKNIDTTLIQLDATPNKSSLGANSILAVSMANLVAHSKSVQKYVYQLIPNIYGDPSLPVPFMNILNGGAHADNSVDIQEFMVAPIGANNFSEALQYGCEIFHSLKSLLKSKGLNTNVGDEGGFAPMINSNNQALDLIVLSIKKSGFINGKDVSICLDVAANELFKKENIQFIQKICFSG